MCAMGSCTPSLTAFSGSMCPWLYQKLDITMSVEKCIFKPLVSNLCCPICRSVVQTSLGCLHAMPIRMLCPWSTSFLQRRNCHPPHYSSRPKVKSQGYQSLVWTNCLVSRALKVVYLPVWKRFAVLLGLVVPIIHSLCYVPFYFP